jgi:hypothetical protein
MFDWAMANPDLMRLMAWSALEQRAKDPAQRAGIRDAKVQALAEAKKAGNVGMAFEPNFLLTVIMSLATAWSAAGPFGPSFDSKSKERPDVLRKSIVEAVRVLANQGKRTRTIKKSKSRWHAFASLALRRICKPASSTQSRIAFRGSDCSSRTDSIRRS